MRKNYFSNNPTPDDNKSRYLVTYSDLITLLLGLFVILYASAQVDEGKYRAMSAAFAQVFNAQDSAKTSGKGILPGNRKLPIGNFAGDKIHSAKSLEEYSRKFYSRKRLKSNSHRLKSGFDFAGNAAVQVRRRGTFRRQQRIA